MLSDKQINEIVSKNMDKFVSAAVTDDDYEVCCDVLSGVVKEALDLAEKSRWKYPHKAEFPDDDQQIFYIAHGQNTFRTGIKKGSMLVENSTGKNYRFNIVKAWTYAPVMEEESLPRAERLEKLTTERDALLEGDV